MKPKDIATIAVCVVIISGALFFAIKMFVPTKKSTKSNTSQQSAAEKTITGDIDQETLDKLDSLKNYGDTNLDNIGRVNPFAPLN